MSDAIYIEGGKCAECDGLLAYPKVENCSCHISPPCHACADNRLTCPKCGWEETPAVREEKFRSVGPGISEMFSTHPSIELGNGKRIFDFDYNSSSGSTMEYVGRYKGDVTAQDIISALGDGTFGHRGPILSNGRFSYVKITD